MEVDAFCLRWNNHQPNLINMVQELLSQFNDVTLLCEDRAIRAHKLVLSACSGYFRRLLTSTLESQQHPFIFFKDVKASEMTAVMRFMYEGQVDIQQQELEGVLRLARTLEVTALSDIKNSGGVTPPVTPVTVAQPQLSPAQTTALPIRGTGGSIIKPATHPQHIISTPRPALSTSTSFPSLAPRMQPPIVPKPAKKKEDIQGTSSPPLAGTSLHDDDKSTDEKPANNAGESEKDNASTESDDEEEEIYPEDSKEGNKSNGAGSRSATTTSTERTQSPASKRPRIEPLPATIATVAKAENGPSGSSPRRVPPCPHCNKPFSSPRALARHVRTHEGFHLPCIQCEKTFTRSDSLKRHLQRQHDQDISFANLNELLQQQESKTSETPNAK